MKWLTLPLVLAAFARGLAPTTPPSTTRATQSRLFASSKQATQEGATGAAASSPSAAARWGCQAVRQFGLASMMGLMCMTSAPTVPAAFAARPQNAASSAGSRVNKDAESLLRYGLPLKKSVRSEVRKLQAAVESIKDDVKAKRITAAVQDVDLSKRLLGKSEAIVAGADPSVKADVQERLAEMTSELVPLGKALASIGPAGSPQEREALDEAVMRQARASDLLNQVEARLVDAPKLASIPEEYADSPKLLGRARVEMVLKKGPNAESNKFDIDGALFDRAVLELIVDGYTAPLTSGNFLDLVNKKFYDNMQIQRSDGFVVQTGDPDGPDGPLAGYGQKSPGDKARIVPLELHFKDDPNSPVYGATSEDLGKYAAATTLPFQAYGALGMAREEYEPDSASSQFFFLLFDSDLTPAGKNLLDGRYTNFGYTVKGEDFLQDVAEGDIIVSAKVLRAPPPFGDYTGFDP